MAAILDLPEMRARVQLWTVAQYEWLAERGEIFDRSELIRGVIAKKMPKSPLHSFIAKRIYDVLMRWVLAGLVVRKEEPLRLADSMPEPDISVAWGAEQDFRSRHPTTAELVVEVAVTSAALDRENASLYAEAGVVEYWIVLGEAEQVEVYHQPVNGSYQSRQVYGRNEAIGNVSVMDGSVPVAALFA